MLESASRGGGLSGPGGGSAWSGGALGAWGGLPGRGVCLVQEGGSAWSRGACLVWGGLPGLGGGVSAWSWGGSGIPACTEADTLHPCGQTDTCKNITLATTSLRPVTSQKRPPYELWVY